MPLFSLLTDCPFPGVTLNKDKKNEQWEQLQYDHFKTKLHIKQILLGHDAQPDEYNVVQLELEGGPKPVKQTVAVLKLGEPGGQTSLADIEICAQGAKFTLISGSGPVHIMGLQFPELTDVSEEHEEEYLEAEASHSINVRESRNNNRSIPFQEDHDDEEDEDAEDGGGDAKGKGGR